ncbi:MAG: ABC transporter ATP-binding protein [Planctomycetes bacterium]|nr:ABC transporter ATP-binding protein [Planctomycetota bacterium]
MPISEQSVTTNGQRAVVQLSEIYKNYLKPDGSVLVAALAGVDLTIDSGDYLAVMGASGSGKSTLMNIVGCLDRPTTGVYRLEGREVSTMGDEELSRVRREKIGFVFQAFNLISELTAIENVEIPLFYQGVGRADRRLRAMACIEQVGLAGRATHRPSELSGGEQQRVAIARALVNEPAMIMADEPTGNLDSKTGAAILEILYKLHNEGMTIIVVTHDERIADQCQRIIELRDGRIEEERRK